MSVLPYVTHTEHNLEIEGLRELVRFLQGQIETLLKRVAELTMRMAELQHGDAKAALEEELARYRAQVSKLQRRLFGKSSEKSSSNSSDLSSELTSPKQSGHGPTPQPRLPVVEQVYTLDDADQICPACGKPLRELKGHFEESEEITYIPPKVVLAKIKRQKYDCESHDCIETALGPLKLIPGGRYSVDFAVHVAIAKYLDHQPLERQVKQLKRLSLDISSQTLWDQLFAAAQLLMPTYEALHRHVLSQPVLFADETTWPMMSDKGSEGWFLWGISSSDAAWYTLANSKASVVAAHILGDYRGIVHADGASAYAALKLNGGAKSQTDVFTWVSPTGVAESRLAHRYPKVPGRFELAHCWAHARRNFTDCQKHFPIECGEVLDLIGRLYAIEHEARHLASLRAGPGASDEQRYTELLQARQELRPLYAPILLQRLDAYLQKPLALPSSALGGAIEYVRKRWSTLTSFVNDPRIELDNNAAERALRGPVIGRHNHLGSRSLNGAIVASIFYSLFESAKLAGIEPAAYARAALYNALHAPGAVTLPSHALS